MVVIPCDYRSKFIVKINPDKLVKNAKYLTILKHDKVFSHGHALLM